jgi:hypothetical protein
MPRYINETPNLIGLSVERAIALSKDYPEVKEVERMVAILHACKEEDGKKMDKQDDDGKMMDEQEDGRPRKKQRTL